MKLYRFFPFSLFFVLLAFSSSISDEAELIGIIKYDDAKHGVYVFEVTGDGELKKLSTGATLDFTNDNPTTPQPPTTTLSQKTKEVVTTLNDPETARELIIAYSVIILSKDDFDSVQQIGQITSSAADNILKDNPNKSKWEVFRVFLDKEFTQAAQRGQLNSANDYANLLEQVRTGLMSSTDDTKMEALDLKTIIDIIKAVLDLFSDGISLEKLLDIVAIILQLIGGGK